MAKTKTPRYTPVELLEHRLAGALLFNFDMMASELHFADQESAEMGRPVPLKSDAPRHLHELRNVLQILAEAAFPLASETPSNRVHCDEEVNRRCSVTSKN